MFVCDVISYPRKGVCVWFQILDLRGLGRYPVLRQRLVDLVRRVGIKRLIGGDHTLMRHLHLNPHIQVPHLRVQLVAEGAQRIRIHAHPVSLHIEDVRHTLHIHVEDVLEAQRLDTRLQHIVQPQRHVGIRAGVCDGVLQWYIVQRTLRHIAEPLHRVVFGLHLAPPRNRIGRRVGFNIRQQPPHPLDHIGRLRRLDLLAYRLIHRVRVWNHRDLPRTFPFFGLHAAELFGQRLDPIRLLVFPIRLLGAEHRSSPDCLICNLAQVFAGAAQCARADNLLIRLHPHPKVLVRKRLESLVFVAEEVGRLHAIYPTFGMDAALFQYIQIKRTVMKDHERGRFYPLFENRRLHRIISQAIICNSFQRADLYHPGFAVYSFRIYS